MSKDQVISERVYFLWSQMEAIVLRLLSFKMLHKVSVWEILAKLLNIKVIMLAFKMFNSRH